MKPGTIPDLTTSGVIARTLGVPLNRVAYILATRPAIRAAARAGMIRLYSRDAIEMVRQEISLINSRRAGRRPGSPTEVQAGGE